MKVKSQCDELKKKQNDFKCLNQKLLNLLNKLFSGKEKKLTSNDYLKKRKRKKKGSRFSHTIILSNPKM